MLQIMTLIRKPFWGKITCELLPLNLAVNCIIYKNSNEDEAVNCSLLSTDNFIIEKVAESDLPLTSNRNSTSVSAESSPSNSMTRSSLKTYKLPTSSRPNKTAGIVCDFNKIAKMLLP